MDEKEILKEEKAFCIPDDTDRKIMQALSGELSEITVSKELFERTLSAAKEQKNGKKRERGYHFAGRMFAVAAAVLLIALGVSLVQNKGNLRENLADGSIGGEFSNSMGHVQNAGGNEPMFPEVSGGEEGGESPASAGSSWNVMEAEGDVSDGGLPEPEQGGREWLYDEMLAAFGTAAEAEDAVLDAEEADDEFPLPAETQEGVRSISWQQDGKELSCIIYEDYRIVATLRENGAVQKLELRDWVYAPQLWELAAE